MKKLTLITLVLLTFYGSSQSRRDHDIENPIQKYKEGQNTYVFSLEGKSQMLNLGNIVYTDKPPIIEVYIVNNSEDTIINLYSERDSHIYWLRKYGNRFDTLMPGNSMIVISKWYGNEPKGSYNNCPILLKYKIGDNIYTNEIKVMGEVNRYKAPPNVEPKNSTLTNNTEIDSLSIFIYHRDRLKGQLYNQEVTIQYRSLNSADSSLVLLGFEDKKTLFINRKSSGWVELKITERDGVSYMKTIYLPIFKRRQNKAHITIFKSDYVHFFQDSEEPYKPNFDLVYIWSDLLNKRKKYKSKLDIIGLTSISKKFPAIFKYAPEIPKSNQIEQLSAFDSIFIAPVFSFEEDHCSYWTNRVEILTNPNLKVGALNDLLHSIGIPNAFEIEIDKYPILEDYSNCSAFRIEFDANDMLSYEFLIKLEKLYNMTQIYKIFTHCIQGVYRDQNGVH